MDDLLIMLEESMKECIASLDKRLSNIRAGRANPGILEGIMVEYYGTETPLNQLANITIPEARQLCIKPFDKSVLCLIEKAIYAADIGLTPNNNGDIIILNIPALTEATRKEYVKQAKGICEDAKVGLRNIRQDGNNDLKKLELPQDDVKYGGDLIQEMISKYNVVVENKFKEKEKDLLSI